MWNRFGLMISVILICVSIITTSSIFATLSDPKTGNDK